LAAALLFLLFAALVLAAFLAAALLVAAVPVPDFFLLALLVVFFFPRTFAPINPAPAPTASVNGSIVVFFLGYNLKLQIYNFVGVYKINPCEGLICDFCDLDNH
jgi:hypothetical protein